MKGFLELQRERENNILYLWTILEFLVAIPSAVSGRGLDSDAPLSLSLSLQIHGVHFWHKHRFYL